MLRASDKVPVEEAAGLTESAMTALDEQMQQGTDGQLKDELPPQVFNIFAWFSPTDTKSETSKNAIITFSETRAMVGSPNSGSTLETLKFYSKNKNLGFKYNTKLDGEDWGLESTGLYDLAEASGNQSEESKKINNIVIRLDGPDSIDYYIYYRVYIENSHWTNWVRADEPVVDENSTAHFEALEVRILPRAQAAPPDSINSSDIPIITATSHMANVGTTQPVIGKNITIGEEQPTSQIEAIAFGTNDPNLNIVYQTSVSDIGWLMPLGNNMLLGTVGENKAVEAIKLHLEGSDAEKFDIFYRTYVEEYGWLDWANNDQVAGTVNQHLKVEALQVRILPKGSLLPGNSDIPSIIAVDINEGTFLKSLNTFRLKKGLSPVTGDVKLNEAARVRLDEVNATYSHIRPNNHGFESVLTDVNYRTDGLVPAIGENFTKTNDLNKAFENFQNTASCLAMMSTDYYKYCSVVSDERGITEILMTDDPSNYSLIR